MLARIEGSAVASHVVEQAPVVNVAHPPTDEDVQFVYHLCLHLQEVHITIGTWREVEGGSSLQCGSSCET